MPRPKATAYRLGDDTREQIATLSDHLTRTLRVPVSGAEVVRLAVRELHERQGLAAGQKKSRKKTPNSIDTGNT